MATKRTDEQRGEMYSSRNSSAHEADAFIAGLRSERRPNPNYQTGVKPVSNANSEKSDEGAVGCTALLGRALREARTQRGWSLASAAVQLGCTKPHLWDMETGRSNNPTLKLVARIAVVYGLPPHRLAEAHMTEAERDLCRLGECGKCQMEKEELCIPDF